MSYRPTHGLSRKQGESFPVYRAWQSMKARCHNKTNKDFYLYGARGISVCNEWRNDFAAFYKYIGNRPSKKHSLDRYPNKNGDYEPENVRWATQLQQAQNVRKNVVLTYNGITKVLAEWGRHLGISQDAIRYHLKNGKPFDKIIAHYEYKKNNPSIKWMPFLSDLPHVVSK